MSNRFDIPYGQDYVSQYVKPPLDYISGMAKDYTSKYNKLEDESYGLNDLIASVKSIDEHAQFKKSLDAKYQPKLSELADKIAKGNDLVQTKRDLNKLSREWTNDPLRIELENSLANRALEQKEKIKLGAKYQKYNDPNIGFKGITETGDIQPLRFSGIPEAQDYQKRASDLVDKIASDSYDSQNDVWDPTTGIIRDRKSGKESVSSQKVRGIANTLVPNFATTLEGQDYIRMIKFQNPNISNEQLGQHLSDYLYNTAAKQIFNKTQSGSGISFDPTYKDKQDAINNGPGASTSEVESHSNQLIPDSIKELLGDDGKLDLNKVANTTSIKAGTTEAGNRIADMGSWFNLDLGGDNVLVSSSAKEKIKEVTDFTKKQMDRFGIPKSASGVQDVNNVIEALNQVKSITTTGTNYDMYPNVKDAISKSLKGNKGDATSLSNTEATSITGDAKMNTRDFMDKNNIDPKSIVFTDYVFDEPGKKKIVALNNSGEEISFYVNSKDLNERAQFRAISAVNNEVEKYVSGKDVKYKEETHLDAGGNNVTTRTVGEKFKDANGNIVQALFVPSSGQFYVVENDSKVIPFNKYKEDISNEWISSKYGSGILQGKSDNQGNIDNGSR